MRRKSTLPDPKLFEGEMGGGDKLGQIVGSITKKLQFSLHVFEFGYLYRRRSENPDSGQIWTHWDCWPYINSVTYFVIKQNSLDL